jgi:hypothetical protein
MENNSVEVIARSRFPASGLPVGLKFLVLFFCGVN